MAAKPKLYTRLTRSVAGLASYSSLWLGGDHLLLVSSTGYSETYARIMLSDIQALFIIPTGRRLWWGITWGVLAGICGIRVGVSLGYGMRPVGSAIFLAVALIALALNWLWGAGCRVLVLTGVQNTKLPSLTRRRKTRAVLARLQPLIAAAQADRPAAAVASVPASEATPAVPAPQPAGEPASTIPPTPPAAEPPPAAAAP